MLEVFLGFLFPKKCLLCDTSLTHTLKICKSCLLGIKYISSPICVQCGLPFYSDMRRNHHCGTCLAFKVYFTQARALGRYEGTLKEAIHQFKYRKKTFLAESLVALMMGHTFDSFDLNSYDFLVPVPLHVNRLRERGFNQALLLARAISKRTSVPVEYQSLKRVKWASPQFNLKKEERERNVKGAFCVRSRSVLKDKTVLLIDDVYTSGATVNECARVLIEKGTARVDVFTLSRTP